MELKKLNSFSWEIPKTGKMNVPAVIFASEKLLELMKKDKTLEQVSNVACMEGIVKHSLAMPDAHQGYGFSIGGVAAFRSDDGIISPGGIGYDINCGVRMMRTNLNASEITPKKQELLSRIFREVPSGLGKGGKIRVSREELDEVVRQGAEWAVNKGYGWKKDLERLEEKGKMDADPKTISNEAKSRGMPQLGSLGSGNHFLEIQEVEKVFDAKAAKTFGITGPGQVTVMFHCGSRGLGHQVASDYLRKMEKEYGTTHLPDRELVNAPIKSALGQDYYSAMSGAANFAWANRQMITHWIRKSFEQVFGRSAEDDGEKGLGLDIVYDVCHNVGKKEEHKVDGEKMSLIVHRKGATRSFAPGRKELSGPYFETGQPVIIPGSMGTASYLLVGTERAMEVSFGSTAHGAGRIMSRHEATRRFSGEKVKRDLESQGILLCAGSLQDVADEAPGVYKDIDEVVRVSHEAGIGNLVAKMRPLGVIKG